MQDDYRDEVARRLGKELLQISTAGNQPLSLVVPRHAQQAFSNLGEASAEFYLGAICASDLERVQTLDELTTLLGERLSRIAEVDDGGWTAF
jgi:hypothetical protein